MIKRINKYNSLFLAVCCFLFTQLSFAQIVQPTSGSMMVTVPAGAIDTYTDSGGASGPYSSQESGEMMICAGAGYDVSVEFTFFDVEMTSTGTCWDELTISGDVNGADGSWAGDDFDAGMGALCNDATGTNGVSDGSGTGIVTALTTIQSAMGGCLTFTFDSDFSVSQDGWSAVVTASNPDNGGGGNGGECQLVCSGDQIYTLGGGECTVEIPNLVTLLGNCDPLLIGNEIRDWTQEFDVSTFPEVFPAPAPFGPFAFNGDCSDLTGLPGTFVLNDGGCNGFVYGIYSFVAPNFDGVLRFDYDITSDLPFGFRGLYWNNGTVNNFAPIAISATEGTGSAAIPLTAGQEFALLSAHQFAGGNTSSVLTNMVYDGGLQVIPFEIVQTGGPMERFLGPGSYDYMYELVDPNGETVDECEFNVTVNPFPNPSASLACNSQVNISVDNDCEVTFNADQFLEGDNYGCYDSLEIYITPFGTGAQTGNVNGASVNFANLLTDASNPHEYEIFDPSTGNRCWGYFIVEDKIAPVVDCPCAGAVEISSFSGTLETSDPQFGRPFAFPQGGACTVSAPADHFYDQVSFTVSATGTYTFNANPSNGDTYGFIYEGTLDPANPCDGAIAGNDDGAGGLDPLLVVDLNAGTTYSFVMTTFSGNLATGDWQVTITSPDGSPLQVAEECLFLCYEKDAVLNSTVATPNPDFNNGDNCGAVTGNFSDVVVGDECTGETVIRTWVFSDASGNTSTCTQEFIINAISVGDLTLPPALVEVGCGVGTSPADIAEFFDVDTRRTPILADDDYAETPDVIENNEGIVYAYPSFEVLGFDGALHAQPVDNNVCKLFASYTDTEINACGTGCHGNVKVIRDWIILDWCSGETTPYSQLIKAVDNEGPTFITKDTTVSTRPWDCTAQFPLPAPWELHDACDINPTWYVTGPAGVTITGNATDGYVATGAPKGVHTFLYTASDCCGNTTTLPVTITVRDQVAPVASTIQDIVVALTPAGPGYESSAKIFTEQVNNYSYDACTDVHIEIRRADIAPACDNFGNVINQLTGERYNNNVTFNNQVPVLHPEDDRNDTDGGQFVKFCCEDVTTAGADVDGDGVLDTGYHEVIMRVWDDANMTGVYGDVDQTGHADNYNEIWAYVKVEDNLPPIITCPADATISCYWAIDLSTDFGAGFQDASQADFEKVGEAVAYSTCQVEDIEFSDRINLDDCGVGTIRRTWRASKEGKNGPQSSQCIQNITVEAAESVFTVTPPNGQPFSVSECEFDVNNISANQKPSVVGGICDVIGESVDVEEFLFEDGVCKKWIVTYNYHNWCTGESMGPIEVMYVYEDTEAPTIECEDVCYSVDANCEYTLSLSKSAIDTSGCTSNGWLKWHVTVDTWADGGIDYVISTYAVDPANGRRITQWATNEALSIQFGVPVTTQWIYVDATASGQDFASTAIPEDLGGKYSKHKVVYKVTDGCHNFASCSEEIEVADKKAPTPYCVSLSTALMADPDGDGPAEPMVELWACDFNVGSFDNCSPQEDLMYTFDNIPFVVDSLVRVGQIFIPVNSSVPHYFDENGFVDWNGNGGLYPVARAATIAAYNRGDIQKWIPETLCAGKVFTCDDAPQADVVMSVWDKQLNVDFCNVFLTFGGEVGDCSTTSTRGIDGTVATATGYGIENAEVQLVGLTEAQITTTGAQGGYAFGFVSDDENVAITPAKDGDDDKGVSTLDLVLIQRHILNISRFDSPYKVIAADINDSETITGADVVELRKLILGVTSEFANNTSWRFVDATQSMSQGGEFPFREDRMAAANAGDQSGVDFVAVKIGDVNDSYEAADNRSAKTVNLTFDNTSVDAGQTVELAISSADYVDAYGYQFTLDLNGLELVDVVAGDLNMTAENVAVLDKNTVTVSYGSTVAETASDLFTIVVKANTAGNVSDMINVTSGVTKAEAYVGDNMEVVQVALSSRGAAEYDLFQNEPNPFKDQTVIGFNMAEEGFASITVFDVAGRVLTQITGEYNKGANTVALNRNDLGGVSGVLYYKLEAADYTATKKMILID